MRRNRASLRKGLQQSSVFDYHVNHGPGLCCRVCMVTKAIVGMPMFHRQGGSACVHVYGNRCVKLKMNTIS